MQITAIDGQALNGVSDIVVTLRAADAQPRTVTTSLRQRSYLAPALDDVQFDAWGRSLYIYQAAGSALDEDEFDELAQSVFAADGRQRTLTGEHRGSEYELAIRVRSMGRTPEVITWSAEIEVLDPYWRGTTLENGSSSPLTVSGNVRALPVITITGGQVVTRTRVTVTSAEPLASYPIAVAVSGAQSTHVVWHHGRRLPFSVSGGFLFARIDTDLPRDATRHRAILDIYSGASITNVLDAGLLDAAGLTLASAINSGTVQADPAGAAGNPLSPALAWLPALTLGEDSAPNSTYGIDGDLVRLVDREETGVAEQLNDDANALKLVSPLGMSSISDLDLDVFVGYRRGQNAAVDTGDGAERVMRVIIAEFGGAASPVNVAGPSTGGFQTHSGGSDKPFYVQWTFGETTFPNTFSEERENVSGFDSATLWYNVAEPGDFQTLAAEWIGCAITTGGPGVFYLHFPDTAFAGADIPLLSMTITPRNATYEMGGDIDTILGEYPKPADLFEALWVDPVTLAPFETDASGASEPEQDLAGAMRVFVKYWLPDSEHPVTAWSRVLRGAATAAQAAPVSGMTVADDPDGGGVVYSASELNLSLQGAVEVAIGLEPAAASPAEIDWGELTVTSTPTISLSQTPSIVTAQVAAQRLDGALVNATTAEQIAFDDVFSDDGGLEIEASGQSSHEVVRGAGGIGPVYGFPLPSNGARWFDLPVGSVSWSKSGDLATATVAFEWAPRLAVDS